MAKLKMLDPHKLKCSDFRGSVTYNNALEMVRVANLIMTHHNEDNLVLFDGVVIVPKFIFTSHWTPSIKSMLFNPCGYPVHFVWSNRGEPITFSKRTMETFLKRFGLVNKSSILSTGEVC